MATFYALVVLCFTNGALAQVIEVGPCPKIDTMPDFNITKVNGKWFLSTRYVSPQDMNLRCAVGDLANGDDDQIIGLGNKTAISRVDGKIVWIIGLKLRMPNPAEPGKLEHLLPSMTAWENHWILASDYENYLVGYNCVEREFTNLRYVWIYTRQRNPSKTVIDDAIKVMEKQNLEAKWLVAVDQTNCDAVMN